MDQANEELASDAAEGVSVLELFFDLVFVFTMTQLTQVVADRPTAAGVTKALLIFGNLWWMYGGFAWLTNITPPRTDRHRLSLLVGMAGFLVAALAIPDAAAGGGITFGVGYLAVSLVHGLMLLGPMQGSFLRAMGWLGPVNLATALLIVAAGLASGILNWGLWIAAFVLHWLTPYMTQPTIVALRSRHFVERHGLIVLIALGESIVAVGLGLGVERVGTPSRLIVTALLALLVVAALWSLYFDADHAETEQAFVDATPYHRAWLAIHVYGYGFLIVLGGIVVFAAGMRRAMIGYDASESLATATLVSGGVAAYLCGIALNRWRLRLGSPWPRLTLALLSLPTVLIGTSVSSLAQLGVVGALLVTGTAVERHERANRRR